MIHPDELDPTQGYLSQLRTLHPIRCGDLINGRRVLATFWKPIGEYEAPFFRLEGDEPWEEHQADA